MCQEQLWCGERVSRWVQLPGALGVATGAIAIGMAATSTSTTTITLIRTTILIATSVARDKVIGNTIRNTAGTLLTATEEQRTSSVVRVRVELVIDLALAVLDVRVAQEARAALAVPEDQVVPAVRAALVVPEDQAVPAVRAALVVQENPVAPAAQAALVVQEDPVVPVVQVSESPAVPVALELVPAVAELEFAQVAVARRTRSVIAAHHRGLVPVLAEEGLAAGAEITHEPAAAEAVIAWAAAEWVAVEAAAVVAAVGWAVVAADVEEVAADVAAEADGEDKQIIRRENKWNQN
jgi:hypothetical protein